MTKALTFYCYIVRTKDSHHYTGITNNIIRRLQEHLHAKRGYCSRHKPKSLIYLRAFSTRKLARQNEVEIKNNSAHRYLLRQVYFPSPNTRCCITTDLSETSYPSHLQKRIEALNAFYAPEL